MTNVQVIEGTWAEILLHADELPRGQRFRLVPIATIETAANGAETSAPISPNAGMLKALGEIDKRQEGRRSISGEDTQRMLRQARAGGLYGLDPTE